VRGAHVRGWGQKRERDGCGLRLVLPDVRGYKGVCCGVGLREWGVLGESVRGAHMRGWGQEWERDGCGLRRGRVWRLRGGEIV
jgi:hypothetical protein